MAGSRFYDHADARSDLEQPLAGSDRLGDRAAEPARQRFRRVLVDQVLAEHDKLVTAVARDRVAFAHLAQQALGDADQQLVTDDVAILVVDALEVVEVDEDHADRGSLPHASGERHREAIAQQRAVRQVRQRIVERPVLERAPRL